MNKKTDQFQLKSAKSHHSETQGKADSSQITVQHPIAKSSSPTFHLANLFQTKNKPSHHVNHQQIELKIYSGEDLGNEDRRNQSTEIILDHEETRDKLQNLSEVHNGSCQKNQVDFFQNNLHFRQCTNCKAIIERTMGCNRITCKCKYQFCYLCGAKWTRYDHKCNQVNGGRGGANVNASTNAYVNSNTVYSSRFHGMEGAKINANKNANTCCVHALMRWKAQMQMSMLTPVILYPFMV